MRNIAEEVLMGINTHETLIHSDEYLGAEYDEGLRHWKYIKKYKNSKGNWTYVYADKSTHGEINKLGEDIVDFKTAAAEEHSDAIRNEKGYNRYYDDPERQRHLGKESYYKALADNSHFNRDYLIEENSVKSAVNRSIKELKTIYKDAIKRGSDFIDDILSKLK